MKKIISITTALILFCVCFVTYKFYNVTNVEDTLTKNIKQNNMLSMMLETSAGSGNYEMTTSSSWPTEDYVFNSELSKCENGGTLSWDDTNKKVMFEGNNVDKCYVYFDVDSNIEYYRKCDTSLLACHIAKYYNGIQGNNSIYLHNSTLTNGANDNSYRFSGGDYILTDVAINSGLTALLSNDSTSTNNVVNFYCNGEKEYVGYTCNPSYSRYYTLSYDTNQTQYSTYLNVLAKAVTDGYITSDNVKNYVYFGSESETCSINNLYRIIGAFPTNDENSEYRIKLVKFDYAGSGLLGTDGDYIGEKNFFYSGNYGASSMGGSYYYWNYASDKSINSGNGSNRWVTSLLNTTNLNTNFYKYYKQIWRDMIDDNQWKISGNTWANIGDKPVKEAYINEIVSPASTITSETFNAKIGLLYASDYGYAAIPDRWIINLSTYGGPIVKSANWLYNGRNEWILSMGSSSTSNVFMIDSIARLNKAYASNETCGIRPVFYLKSSIIVESGTGTKSDPYRIK